MEKEKNPPKDEPEEPLRTEQARHVAEKYADDLREIIEKLRRKMN